MRDWRIIMDLMRSVAELEDRLSTPCRAIVEDVGKLEGDILVLGAGGKLGPSLVTLAVRALEEARSGSRVIAVSRFSAPGSAEMIASNGARVIEADLTDDDAIAALPDAANVIFLVGSKFGTSGQEHSTWATNSYLPGRIIERFPTSRMVALSTGNVYPLIPIDSGGCTEATPPDPMGEYAMSCLGRERILEHFSIRQQTAVALIRLNYAVEMRYGVLVDIARAVLVDEPVDVSMGYVNLIWQGYANEVILRALHHASSPPFVLNLTGPELVSIRQVALSLGELMGETPSFSGSEAPTALLSNAQRCHTLFGYPDVSLADLVENVANWVGSGLPLLNKPTGFERRDGRF